ncbi:MAG TPA: CHAT domain-containing protein [Thermoanaerobaculia bacterium]|nr:CHAT domain-containing protein [Thermoanaerobaculia bacterium]
MPKVLATVACLAALAGCRPEQAPDRSRCLEEGLGELVETRWVEPRLSGGFAWGRCEERLGGKRLLGEVICPASHNPPTSVSRSSEACDDAGTQHLDALRRLTREGDVDGAITTLTALASEPAPDPRVWSDLAGALMVRARRLDSPSDLLHAIKEARKAVAVPDPSPEALFNLALAQESLHLPRGAAKTWAIYLQQPDDPHWAAEGRAHRDRLESDRLRAAATAWPLNKRRLPNVVRLGDPDAVTQLVAPFPGAAQRYVEDEVLPAWARATERGEGQAPQHLAEAREIAAGIARATGDRYLRDVVEVALEASDSAGNPSTLQALVEGHAAFGQARQLERQIAAAGVEKQYRQASAALATAGSPLAASADVGIAVARYREAACPQVLAQLQRLGETARRRGYESLLGRVLWVRGLCLSALGRFPEALEVYEEAFATYRRMGDYEGAANVRARLAGVARDLGEKELAWRHAWQALRDLRFVVEIERQAYSLGEAAAAALVREEPQTALLYQSESIDRLSEDLTPRQREDPLVPGLRLHLGIALRARAPILADLNRHRQATADVHRAILLFADASNEGVRRALLARAKEAEARTLLKGNLQAAIRVLKEGLSLYPPGQFGTYRATLQFLLARIHQRTGDADGAEEAFKAGLEEIGAEEQRVLDLRKPGSSEQLWGPYFSRFSEAYQQLVRLLIDQGRHAEAFAYAERARALEPLDLVLRLRSKPREFERLIAQREPLELAKVQAQLPAGTFLLDYYLLDRGRDGMDDEELVVWIVWREGFELLRRRVGRREIQRWAEVFQTTKEGDSERFIAGLEEAFTKLVGAPLQRLAGEGRRAEIKRLVVIPDGGINGLPLAALRDPATNRHLVQDYPIEVAPSATLYVFSLLRDRQLRGEPASALLVGNPTFDTELESARGLGPLKWADREVAGIEPLYRPLAEVLESERATVDDFLRRARAKRVIHFAGHAVANPDVPSRSVLLLARSATHSGALTAEELLSGLELEKTRLVVLSACSSAGGGPIGPSGLAPLVRPFLAGGVPAVVGTLWNVRDAVAAELLESFHNHLAAGEDAAGALREAQLEVIRKQSTKAELVLVWAPFQVVGHASSPFPPN